MGNAFDLHDHIGYAGEKVNSYNKESSLYNDILSAICYYLHSFLIQT